MEADMAGVVVVNGQFEPGSVVKLLRVADESVLRAEGGELVGERQVDGDGVVGWDGVEVGASYFACGYVTGGYLEIRCRGVEVSDPNAALTQAPIQPVNPPIGTQNEPNLPEPPAPPVIGEDDEPLEVGLPDGVSLNTLGVKTYYFHNADGAVSPDWHDSGLQAPAETGADGTVLDARPLYVWEGEGEPDLGEGTGEKPEWEAYEGVTEPVGTTPQQSEHTDTSGEAPADGAAATGDVPASESADAPAAQSGGTDAAPSSEQEVTVSAPGDVSVEASDGVQVESSAPLVDPSTAPTDGDTPQPEDAPASPAAAEAPDAGGEASASVPPAEQSQPDASQPEPPVAAPDPGAPSAPETPAEQAPEPAPAEPAPDPAPPAPDAPADGGAPTDPPA